MNEIIETKKQKCGACNGEGKVADTDDKEPWSMWNNLPPGADLAVRMGFVKPVDCERCLGKGFIYIPKESVE